VSVLSDVTTFALDATYNWWGNATGPTHTSNPDGIGSPVGDNVTFSPFWADVAMTEPRAVNVGDDEEVVEVLSGTDPVYSLGYTNGSSLRFSFTGTLTGKTLTVKQVSDITTVMQIPENKRFLKPAYYYNITFDTTGVAADLAFGYDDATLTGLGIDEDSLKVSFYDSLDVSGYTWHELTPTIDKVNKTVTVSTTHFSIWAVTGGTDLVTGVNDDPVIVGPVSYRLGDNYPNPFNPTTNIPFELRSGGDVTLSIYNAIGQEVAVVTNTYYPAGAHVVQFNAVGLSTGIYFYKLEVNGYTEAKRLVIIR
jgi:hypothetical protein